ncbi:MAG: protein kinase [Planctomycetia bacterium]|nr:protein kinase [Planctomycetia bacterium]
MNANETNFSVSMYLSQWQKERLNGVDLPWDFAASQTGLSEEQRQDLAIALIADDFRRRRANDEPIWIEKEMDIVLPLFEQRGIPLDFDRVLRCLIQADIQTLRHRPDPEGMIDRFPEMKEYILQCFEASKKYLSSLVRRLDEQELQDFGNPTRPEGESVSLTEKYDVTRFIQAGGQKNVYEVRQQSTNQPLAFKELKGRYRNSSIQQSTMLAEAVLQARLSHPNIPIILSLNSKEGELPAFVERLVPGSDWGDVIDEFPLERNISLLLTVCRIVAFAHKRHIIHGDLKPDNVMLGESGDRYNDVYLVDWGFALALNDPDVDNRIVGGTIPYMPPESVDAIPSRLSLATDVFMLGGILYRILVGKAPYEDPYHLGPIDALGYVSQVKFDPVPEVHPKTGVKNPEALIEIVNKALQRNQEDRFVDAEQFAAALERYQTREGLIARLDHAQDTFESIQQRALPGKPSAAEPFLLELVENVNEFRLIRTAVAESEKSDLPLSESPAGFSNLYRDASQKECVARSFLIESALRSKDFGIVAAQIQTAENFLQEMNRSGLTETSASDTAQIQTFRTRLRQGLAARRRERFIKWSLGIASLCVLVALVAIFRLAALNAEQGRINAEQEQVIQKERADRAEAELRNRYAQVQQLDSIAEKEKFGQGRLALFSQMPQLSGEVPLEWQKEVLLRTSLLCEETSPRKGVVDALGISRDGQFFAELSSDNWVSIYSMSHFCLVDRFPVLLPSNAGDCFLLANPLFEDEAARQPVHSARFLVCAQNGVVIFLAKQKDIRSQTINFNDVNGIPAEKEFKLGKPVFLTQEAGKTTMIVDDAEGNLLFFSFPDGKLLKQVKAHENGMTCLVLSQDGKTIATAGGDGLFKLWKSDGTPIKTLALPFAETPHERWKFVRRVDISPSGNLILASAETGKVVVWDIAAEKILAEITEPELPGTEGNLIQRVYWLDETRFVSLCLNNHYRIWNLAQRDEEGNPKFIDIQDPESRPALGIRAAVYSLLAKRLVIHENNHTLSVFDTETGEKLGKTTGILKLSHPNLSVTDARYHPGADSLLVGNFAYYPIISYDPRDLEKPLAYLPYPSISDQDVQRGKTLVSNLAFPDVGKEFAASLGSGDMVFFEVGNPTPIRTLSRIFRPFSADDMTLPIIAASPEGKTFAHTTTTGRKITLCQWNDGEVIRSWQKDSVGDEFTIFLAFVSEDRVLELTFQGTLTLWDVQEGKELATTKLMADRPRFLEVTTPSAFALSWDKKEFAVGFSDGSLQIVQITDLSLIGQSMPEWSNPLSNYTHTSPYALERADTEANIGGHMMAPENAVTGVDWSRDDSILVLSFSSGTNVITDLKTKEILARFVTGIDEEQVVGQKNHCFFTTSGKLLTVGTDGLVRRWDYCTSSEPFSIQKEKHSADRITAGAGKRWAGLTTSMVRDYSFFLHDGEKETFRRGNIEFFSRFWNSEKKECFILLGKDGKLDVINDEGKSIEHPVLTAQKGIPKGGFVRVYASPCGRWIAAIGQHSTSSGGVLSLFSGSETKKGACWLFDSENSAEGWKRLELFNSSFQEDETDSVQVAFRADSQEMAVADSDGAVVFWSLKDKKQLFPTNRVALVGPDITTNRGKITYTKSGRFLVQTGLANFVAVWDAETRTLMQKVPLQMFDSFVSVIAVDGLVPLGRGFGAWENEDAFVAAGDDGVLRFYQFIPEKFAFECVYVVSSLKLETLMGSARRGFSDDLGINFSPIKDLRLWIKDLATDVTGNILYVATVAEARTYDLTIIHNELNALGEKWEKRDVQALSGLLYFPRLGLYPAAPASPLVSPTHEETPTP